MRDVDIFNSKITFSVFEKKSYFFIMKPCVLSVGCCLAIQKASVFFVLSKLDPTFFQNSTLDIEEIILDHQQ